MACTHNGFVDAVAGQSRHVQGATCSLYLRCMPTQISALTAMPCNIQDAVAAVAESTTAVLLNKAHLTAQHWHLPALHQTPTAG